MTGPTPLRKPPANPVVALAKALQAWWHLDMPGIPGSGSWEAAGGWENDAEDILAALDGWTLVPKVATADWTGSTRKDAEIASREAEGKRVRAALGRHHRAEMVTTQTCKLCRAALLEADHDR